MTHIDQNQTPLTDRQIELLKDKAVTKYLSALEKVNEHYMQMFGDIEIICDIYHLEKK